LGDLPLGRLGLGGVGVVTRKLVNTSRVKLGGRGGSSPKMAGKWKSGKKLGDCKPFQEKKKGGMERQLCGKNQMVHLLVKVRMEGIQQNPKDGERMVCRTHERKRNQQIRRWLFACSSIGNPLPHASRRVWKGGKKAMV